MNEPQRTQQTVAGLLFLCFLLYFGELGQIPFYNYEESKEALVVWEMVNDGGVILPLRNGIEIPLKPPLFHWCGAVISWISGKANEFAVRSPSAFFSTGSVLLIFFFGQRFWQWRVGLLASLVTATSPEWIRWATYARSDMVMVFFLTAAGFLFFRVWEERGAQRQTLYLFYLCVGLATLAKGPLGLVLPGLVSVIFLVVSRDIRFVRQMRLFEGAAIVIVVAISWYLLALEQAGWEFFRRQILNENVYRFFETEQGGPSRDHAWYYYLPALCAGMFPWSLFFPALIHFLYRSREELRDPKVRYLLIWVVSGLIFFSLASGKRANYLLPLYPPIALLFANWWEELVEGQLLSSILAKRLARVNALVLCGAFALVILFLTAHSAGFDLDHIVSPFLHPRDRNNIPLVAYSLQSQFPVVLIWLLLLAFAIGWYLVGLRKDQWMSVFAALVVATSSSLYFTSALFHPLLARERTYKPFMLGVRSTVKNAPLYFYKGAYDYGAIFYANRHIPPAPPNLLTTPEPPKAEEAQTTPPTYLLLWEEDWQTLSATDPRFEHLVTSEGRGPDKKHRLVLTAFMPEREHPQEGTANETPPPSEPTSTVAEPNGPSAEPAPALAPPEPTPQPTSEPEAAHVEENTPLTAPSTAMPSEPPTAQPDLGAPPAQPETKEGADEDEEEGEDIKSAPPAKTQHDHSSKKPKRSRHHTRRRHSQAAVHHRAHERSPTHSRHHAALTPPQTEQLRRTDRLTGYLCAPLRG
jgi:4-amino-4-deoxy-L-arabinose transferase-like glycosyltransferase